MKWALLLNFVLITLVAGSGAWKQNKEYKYKVLTKTLTASPKLTNRYTGTVLRARLLINPQSENVLIGKVDDAEYAEIQLSEKWDADFNEDELSYNKYQQLNKLFKIYLENGVIKSLSVDRTMTRHQKTQLKAIISQLQVDTNKVEGGRNNAFYETTEQTVTGNCETTYDISPLPDYLVQHNSDFTPLHLEGEEEFIKVVKTRNHNKCTERYGLINEQNYYRMDNNLVHSEDNRIVLSGSLRDYTIQSSVTINKIISDDRQTFSTIHYVNLKLESMTESSIRPRYLQDGYGSKIERLSFYDFAEKGSRRRNSYERIMSDERMSKERIMSNEKMVRSDEEKFRSNEQIIGYNEQMSRSNEQFTQRLRGDDGQWSGCYTWFVGTEEMCRQSFDAQYSAVKEEGCGFLGHRSLCVRKFPGCESSACWSGIISNICDKEFGDRLPIHKGGFADCSPGFVRHRCCPK